MYRAIATPTVQIDNSHQRVTEWRLAPDVVTDAHRRERDHVHVVVLGRDRELKPFGPKGKVAIAKLHVKKSHFRDAGAACDVVNIGPGEMAFIEIEPKGTAIEKAL